MNRITRPAHAERMHRCAEIGKICAALGICTKTGYRLLRDGSIVSRKVGRKYCISKTHLLTYPEIKSAIGGNAFPPLHFGISCDHMILSTAG